MPATSSSSSSSSSRLECRWGVLGCGAEASCFVAELQRSSGSSSNGAKSSVASTSTAPDVKHTIIAVAAAGSAAEARAFADAHVCASVPAAATSAVEAFGTSTELHAHPGIDSIFVAGSQAARYREALSALRGGKNVLIPKPMAISSAEARELCEHASKRDKPRWLGFVMRRGAGSGEVGGSINGSHGSNSSECFLWAADECARGMAASQTESERLPWSQSIAVLETLDEFRSNGLLLSLTEDPLRPPFPRSPANDSADVSFASSDGRGPGSRASFGSDAAARYSPSLGAYSGEEGASAKSVALRSQVQELKHILRQKAAVITSLEQKAGVSPGSSERLLARQRVRASLPPLGVGEREGGVGGARVPSPLLVGQSIRARTPSIDGKRGADADSTVPFADVGNTANAAPGVLARRRRKDATSNGSLSLDLAQTPPSANNQLGLESVPEGGRGSVNGVAEGFLSPTIASESRRIASTGSPKTPLSPALANGIAGTPPPGGKGSSKVIEALTNDLSTARSALDLARTQLRTSQRTVATLQRSLDETRDSLGRSRAENESASQMMARKERQVQEVLDRARKAETEAKELGKSSREWGARVRKIEAELGEERVNKQRIEMQYEALSTSWKQTREAWEKEMSELRMNQGDAVRRNREEAQRIQATFKAAQEAWEARDVAGGALQSVLGALEAERKRATAHVEDPVRKLVQQLQAHEDHTAQQDASVAEVQSELRRILRLMRAPSS